LTCDDESAATIASTLLISRSKKNEATIRMIAPSKLETSELLEVVVVLEPGRHRRFRQGRRAARLHAGVGLGLIQNLESEHVTVPGDALREILRGQGRARAG
jgi:hypothetical protein